METQELLALCKANEEELLCLLQLAEQQPAKAVISLFSSGLIHRLYVAESEAFCLKELNHGEESHVQVGPELPPQG
jgi:hypothetical protein